MNCLLKQGAHSQNLEGVFCLPAGAGFTLAISSLGRCSSGLPAAQASYRWGLTQSRYSNLRLLRGYFIFVSLQALALDASSNKIATQLRCAALWPRQESNLNQELRKLAYYPLYYEAIRASKKVDASQLWQK